MAKKRSSHKKKKNTATAAATAKPRKKVVRSTRHSRADQPILDDARLVASAARKHFGGIKKYDAARAKKLLPAARIDAFEKQTRAASILVGGKRTARTVTAAATRAEEKARAVVFEMVAEARDLVGLGIKEDDVPAMRKAFLVGAKVQAHSTPSVVSAAADVQQAWGNALYQQHAIGLGITKASIAKLIAARRALIAADTSQGAAKGARVGATGEKTATVRAIERETAYVRKVAKLAFKGQPKVLAAFAKKTPRALARPKKAVAAGGGTSGSTAGGGSTSGGSGGAAPTKG